MLAGVNPIFALYAVMLATPVGALFASSVFMSVQTTSAMSLLVADVPQVHDGENAAGALFMLTILTGVIMLAAGLLKLGSYLRYVPNAVLTGFINGVAVLIILGQLGDLTGTSPQGSNKVVADLGPDQRLDGHRRALPGGGPGGDHPHRGAAEHPPQELGHGRRPGGRLAAGAALQVGGRRPGHRHRRHPRLAAAADPAGLLGHPSPA